MGATAILPATEELDDIVCVCPKCGTETKRTIKSGRSSGKQRMLC
jgi:transposase-like protein